jgi:hypothetical protein
VRERIRRFAPSLSLLPKHRAAGNRNTETLPTPPGTSATVTDRRYELKPPAAKARKEALLKNIEPMKEWAKDGK